MLTYRNILLFISTSLFIFGCSSSSKLVESSFLKTHIQANDAKIFTLYLTPVNDRTPHASATTEAGSKIKPSKGKGKGDRQGRRDQSHQSSPQEKKSKVSSRYQEEMSEALLDTLNETLRENGYCREGYIELNRTLGKGLVKIKGECHESATPADKKMFPNAK